MLIGLPVWTAALDIANSSLAKKVPYSIAPPPEHMATDPISLVEQLKKISSISIDIDFDETLDKLHGRGGGPAGGYGDTVGTGTRARLHGAVAPRDPKYLD